MYHHELSLRLTLPALLLKNYWELLTVMLVYSDVTLITSKRTSKQMGERD